MNSTALIMMLLTQGLVISVTGYFLYRVLTITPKKDTTEDNQPF